MTWENDAMPTSLVLTIVGPDRPGLVNLVSDRATAHGANWLESRMANLAGQFAGIVLLQIPDAKVQSFSASLAELESQGLRVTVARGADGSGGGMRRLHLELLGQDRPGIVRDISSALARQGVSIDELVTDCVSGSMSGEALFRAQAQLRVPVGVETRALRVVLESIANDLMVDVTLDESDGASADR
jgi:glycine cleavage system regulatory protein